MNFGEAFAENQTIGWNILLTLSYNFWDRGQRRREVEIAERNQMISEHTFRSQALSTVADLRKLMLDLEQLRNTYHLSRDLMQSEEETYGFLVHDYREGKVQSYDLIANLKDVLSREWLLPRLAIHSLRDSHVIIITPGNSMKNWLWISAVSVMALAAVVFFAPGGISQAFPIRQW